MKAARILIVDDEPLIRQSLAACWKTKAIKPTPWRVGEECCEELRHTAYDLVLLDVWLPGMDGLETLARIQEIPFADRPAVVIISGHGTIETAVKATKLGAFDFLEKPLTIEKVSVVVKNALQQRRLELELSGLKEDGRQRLQIIGDSVPMKALRQQLALMAATNGRVLIYGESGTGKELVAHAIHGSSQRASEAVRRSELRGHPRRADRERAVRPSQGQLCRRAGGQDRQAAEGRRRHAVSRRSRRHEPEDPGQGAARAGRAALRAGGRGRHPFRWMCAWWRPPTRTWRRRSSAAISARTCSIA